MLCLYPMVCLCNDEINVYDNAPNIKNFTTRL